jgi:hypothetical protein
MTAGQRARAFEAGYPVEAARYVEGQIAASLPVAGLAGHFVPSCVR